VGVSVALSSKVLIKIRYFLGPRPTGLRSDGERVFLFKIWAPFLLGLALVLIVTAGRFPGSLLLVVPLTVAFLFHLTLAQVQVRGRKVLFRRGFGWAKVDVTEINASGQAWVFGYNSAASLRIPLG
jgi:hypothetical protein